MVVMRCVSFRASGGGRPGVFSRVTGQGEEDLVERRLAQGDVVEVHARRRDHLPAVAQALARLDEGTPQIDESTRRVTVGVAGRDGLLAAMRSLESREVEVDDIALRQPTLDEVFLALTGRHAETNDQPREKRAA